MPELPKARCVFASPYFSIVPEELYSEGEEERLLQLGFSEEFEEGRIDAERIPLIDARVVHWSPDILPELLTERYPGHLREHFAPSGIETLFSFHSASEHPCGMVHIRRQECDIGFVNDGELQAFNSFSYANAEELVYFVLHAWKHCGIEAPAPQLHITGTQEQREEKELLQRYLPDPVLHEDEKGSWRSFITEELTPGADHRRKA